MTDAALRRILLAGIQAPSAENCQPWTFRWDGATLAVDHDAARARKGRDEAHHDSLLALGALLESVGIAAEAEGYAVDERLSVADPAARTWARLTFRPGPRTERAALATEIPRRNTDRRPFRGADPTHPVFAAIRADAARWPRCGVSVLGAPTDELIAFYAEAEGFVWAHDAMYADVMRWLRVTQREVEETRDGASWRTMGLDLPELPALARLRHPRARPLLARAGAPRAAGTWLRRQVKSGALVQLTVRTRERTALVDAGRLLLTAWLRLTAADHGVQPHSQQSYFLHENAVGTLPADVGPAWRARFAEGLAVVRRAFALDPDALPVLLLRVGRADSPPAWRRTLRRPLEDVVTVVPFGTAG